MVEFTEEMRGWLKGMLLQLGVPEDMIYEDPRWLVWQFREHVKMSVENITGLKRLLYGPEINIAFTPGQFITETLWKDAQRILRTLRLFHLLPLLGVREVRVVPNSELPPGIPRGGMTVWPSTGTILCGDIPPFPSTFFAFGLVHESVHMWQQLNPDPRTGEGIPIDPVKAELPAYMMSQLCHWLNGDGIEVFRPPIGQTPPYPAAVGLM